MNGPIADYAELLIWGDECLGVSTTRIFLPGTEEKIASWIKEYYEHGDPEELYRYWSAEIIAVHSHVSWFESMRGILPAVTEYLNVKVEGTIKPRHTIRIDGSISRNSAFEFVAALKRANMLHRAEWKKKSEADKRRENEAKQSAANDRTSAIRNLPRLPEGS
jgi:hypothetical protein